MKAAEVIKKYRIMNEMSQRKLADEIGVDHSTFCRFENGEDISARTMMSIINWLFEDATNKKIKNCS